MGECENETHGPVVFIPDTDDTVPLAVDPSVRVPRRFTAAQPMPGHVRPEQIEITPDTLGGGKVRTDLPDGTLHVHVEVIDGFIESDTEITRPLDAHQPPARPAGPASRLRAEAVELTALRAVFDDPAFPDPGPLGDPLTSEQVEAFERQQELIDEAGRRARRALNKQDRTTRRAVRTADEDLHRLNLVKSITEDHATHSSRGFYNALIDAPELPDIMNNKDAERAMSSAREHPEVRLAPTAELRKRRTQAT